MSATDIAEFEFQVHPNRRDQTHILCEAIDALTDSERSQALHFLCGYDPRGVQYAIDHLRGEWL